MLLNQVPSAVFFLSLLEMADMENWINFSLSLPFVFHNRRDLSCLRKFSASSSHIKVHKSIRFRLSHINKTIKSNGSEAILCFVCSADINDEIFIPPRFHAKPELISFTDVLCLNFYDLSRRTKSDPTSTDPWVNTTQQMWLSFVQHNLKVISFVNKQRDDARMMWNAFDLYSICPLGETLCWHVCPIWETHRTTLQLKCHIKVRMDINLPLFALSPSAPLNEQKKKLTTTKNTFEFISDQWRIPAQPND
jgi:hypothetical protein